jgi:hypothetical protein
MRDLTKILFGAFLAFMVLALVEERKIFFPGGAAAGRGADRAVLSDQDSAEAVAAVRRTLALLAHYYGSGGDERFAERMPASDVVRQEIAADIRYLRANHRRQEPTLQRLEVESVRSLGEGAVEIRTREFWIHRFFWIGGSEELETPRSQVIYGNYLVSKQAQSWRVEGFEFSEPDDSFEENGER